MQHLQQLIDHGAHGLTCAPLTKMKRVEFTPPEGFRVPEGTQPTDTFEAMATFQLKKDGRMCLVAVGDHKMPGYKDGEEDSVAGRYHSAM